MSSPAIGQDRRAALWNALLDAEMNVIAWTLISRHYNRLDQAFKLIIAVASSGTVAAWSIWSNYPAAWKMLSAVAAIASLVHPLLCSSERLTRMSRLVGTWKEIAIKYELLWEQDSDLGAAKSWKDFEATKKREGKIDETRLPVSRKLVQIARIQVLRKRGFHVG